MTSLSFEKTNFRIKLSTINYTLVFKPIKNLFNRVDSDRTYEKICRDNGHHSCSPDVPWRAGNAPASCNKPPLNIYYNSILEQFINN